MNPIVGWSLAVLAVAAGFVGWGWPGVVLALTVVVFWLLLQFSQTLRVLRAAGQRPVGHVQSAIMLNSRLRAGLRLLDVIRLTGSLGHKLGDEAGSVPEAWRWVDAGGDAVRVELASGRVSAWRLERAPEEPAASGAPDAPAPPEPPHPAS